MPQDRDDLRFSVSACLHSKSPRSSCRENSTYPAPYFRGGLPQRIHKAADLSVDWQDTWADFLKSKTPHKARAVITKGEALLKEQAELSLALKPRDYVRHRILVAENDLQENPEAPKHTSKRMADLQAYLTQLSKRDW